MNKFGLLSVFMALSNVITPPKPVVYFSNVTISPFEIGKDKTISFEYVAPEAYSEVFTTFICKVANQEVDSFKRYPGYGFFGEFTIPQEVIYEGEIKISLVADCYLYTVDTSFVVYTEQKKEININQAIENNQELSISNSVVKVEKYGEVVYIDEKYELFFERKIYEDSLYKIDLSSIQFKYSLVDYQFEYQSAEMILYGTKDDFPRLFFLENDAGYKFNIKIVKKDYYQLQIDEQFYIDKETLMISKSSGDYFNKTNELYVSKTLRKKQNQFPFKITIKGAGIHKSTLIYEGIYVFNNEPLGLSYSSSVSIIEENNDSKIGEDYQEW